MRLFASSSSLDSCRVWASPCLAALTYVEIKSSFDCKTSFRRNISSSNSPVHKVDIRSCSLTSLQSAADRFNRVLVSRNSVLIDAYSFDVSSSCSFNVWRSSFDSLNILWTELSSFVKFVFMMFNRDVSSSFSCCTVVTRCCVCIN